MRRLLYLMALCVTAEGYASITITKSGEATSESLDLGLGLRTELRSMTKGADGQETENFAADFDARIYLTATFSPMIKLTLNTGYSEGDIKLLDAITRFEPIPELNVWAGRFLPPSDRSNFSGPYYLNAWVFPSVVQRFPAVFAGRDNGVALWGGFLESRIKYQLGAFEGLGRDPIASQSGTFEAPNAEANPLYAGRLTFNFLEPEPGYYNSSTWFGQKQIFAIGLAYQLQKNATGFGDGVDTTGLVAIEGVQGDLNAGSIDMIYETPLAKGAAFTVEGAYYTYDSDNLDRIRTGTGFMMLTSYLLPKIDPVGQLQPLLRYQEYQDDEDNDILSRMDVQLNYIMKGHSARLSLVAAREARPVVIGTDRVETLSLGTQFQF